MLLADPIADTEEICQFNPPILPRALWAKLQMIIPPWGPLADPCHLALTGDLYCERRCVRPLLRENLFAQPTFTRAGIPYIFLPKGLYYLWPWNVENLRDLGYEPRLWARMAILPQGDGSL